MSDCVGAGRARGEGAADRPRHRLQGGGHQRAAAPAGECRVMTRPTQSLQ